MIIDKETFEPLFSWQPSDVYSHNILVAYCEGGSEK